MKKFFIVCFCLFAISAIAVPGNRPAPASPFGAEESTFSVTGDTAEMTVPGDKNVTVSVFKNDEGKSLKIRSVSTPGHGWTSYNSNNGKITYTPQWNFIGTDSFTYSASEGWSGTQETATVTVTVNGPAAPEAKDLTIDTTVRTSGSVTVDLEEWQSFVSYNFSPAHGTASASGSKITYEPAYSFAGGSDSFTYEIKDIYGRTSTGTVNVNVSPVDPPVAENLTINTTVRKSGSVNVDFKNGQSFAQYTFNPEHGTASASGNKITYEPAWAFAGGSDSFTYTIKDEFNRTSTGNVNVNVIPVDPPAAKDLSAETDENKNVKITVIFDDSGYNAVVDGSYRLKPSHGSAWMSNNTKIEYQPQRNWSGADSFTYQIKDDFGQTATGTVTVQVGDQTQDLPETVADTATTEYGEAVSVDVVANDSGNDIRLISVGKPSKKAGKVKKDGNNIVFTPADGFVGTTEISYTIKDADKQTADGTLTVIVNAPSVAELVNDTAKMTVPDDKKVEIEVLANDTGEDLKIESTSNPEHGEIKLKSKNTKVQYTPDSGYVGTDSFTYTTVDSLGRSAGPATVTVTVNGPEAPVAVADEASMTIPDEKNVEISVLENDTGDDIAIESTTNPEHGEIKVTDKKTKIKYTPSDNYIGTDTFTYTVKDSLDRESEPATVVVVVNGTNWAVNDEFNLSNLKPNWDGTYTLSVLSNDDGQGLEIESVEQPNHGKVDIASHKKSLLFLPEAGYKEFNFKYTVKDKDGNTAEAEVICLPPDKPTVADDEFDLSTMEAWSNGWYNLDVLDNDEHVDLSINSITQSEHGQVEIKSDGKSIMFLPEAGYDKYEFTYTAVDPSGYVSDEATVVCYPPKELDLTDDEFELNDMTPNWDGTYTLAVLNNDNEGGIEIESVEQPEHGTVTIPDHKKSLLFLPEAGYDEYKFSYTVKNTAGYTGTAEVTCYPPNPPKVVNDEFNLSELTPWSSGWYNLNVLDNDDWLKLEITSVTQPEHGEVEIRDGGGSLMFLPEEGYNQWTFTYKVKTPSGFESDSATVKIYDGLVNVEAQNDSVSTTEGAPVEIDVLANDTGRFLTIQSVTAPEHGTAEMSDSKILYTPISGFAGSDSFTYTVVDVAEATATATVNVAVNSEGGGGENPGEEYEVPESIIEGTSDELVNILTIDGTTLKKLDPENYSEDDVIPAIDLIQFKQIYNKYNSQTGNSEYKDMSDMLNNMAELRMNLEDGDSTDTQADIQTFNNDLEQLYGEHLQSDVN